jgi:hypothetical protein
MQFQLLTDHLYLSIVCMWIINTHLIATIYIKGTNTIQFGFVSGYATYVGLLMLELYHRNPVLIVFCEELHLLSNQTNNITHVSLDQPTELSCWVKQPFTNSLTSEDGQDKPHDHDISCFRICACYHFIMMTHVVFVCTPLS